MPKLLYCLALTGALSAVAAAPVPGEKVIYQLDFDEHLGPEFAVDPYHHGATLSKDNPHSGTYCLEGRGGGGPFQYFGQVDKLSLQAGRSYRLSVWARTADTPLSFVHIFYHVDGKMTSPPQGARLQIANSATWREHELTFTVGPQVEGGELRFRFAQAAPTARAWFDDLTLALLPPGLKTDYRCSSQDQIVTVRANVADYVAATPLEEMTLQVDFIGKNNGQVAATTSYDAVSKLLFEVECPITKLAAGDYTIHATLRNGRGEALDTSDMPFGVFREPAWAGNSIGKLAPGDAPPPPWTPLRFDGSKASVWGREIELGANGLPSSVVVEGREILAAPVGLALTAEGGSPSPDALSAPSGDGLAARWESTAGTGALAVRTTTEIEFDGLLKHTVRLSPRAERPARVEKLTLRIPLRAEVARLLQAIPFDGSWGGSQAVDLAATPSWESKEFRPHLWLGDESRGLAWFAETAREWNAKAAPLRTELEGGALSLIVTIIDQPTVIDRPREIVFGLQPTPTRPPHPRWQDMRFRTKALQPNVGVIWASTHYDRYYGFPREVENTERLEKMLASTEYQLRLIYQTYADSHLPEFRYYEDRWRGPGSVYNLDGTGFDSDLLPANYTDPLWQDFLVSELESWVKRWKVRGLYHDCFGPHTIGDTVHIFSFRELAKRVYTMHRRIDPTAMTIVFGAPYVPCVSFADGFLSGEMYRAPLAEKQWYPAFLSLPQFRVENSVKLGPSRMILPQYKIAYGNSAPHAVHAMGMFLLHDLPLYAAWLNMEVYEAVETRRLTFGREGFHGYWEADPRVRVGDQGLKASWYRKPGRLLVTVANVTGQDINSTLALDLAGLGLAAGTQACLYDPLTNSETKLTLGPEQRLEVKVPAWMMLLIEVGQPN